MLALLFQVGSDRLAVDVRLVREVVPRVRLMPATGSPHWIAGEFVYRGQVVPVIDLHRLIGAGECPLHLSSRIILLPAPDQPNSLVGFLATQVAEIRDVPLGANPSGLSVRSAFGPAFSDGSEVLHHFEPTALLERLGRELAAGVPGATS